MSDTIQVKMFDPGRDERPESWLVEDLLPEKTVTILASRPKSGKTVFTTALSFAVATGQPFLGRKTSQGGVLWFASEESEAEREQVQRAIPYVPGSYPKPEAFNRINPSEKAVPIFTAYTPLILADPFHMKALRELIDMVNAKLIVFDPLITMAGRKDLGASKTARETIDGLRAIARNYDVTIIVLHQLNHSNRDRRCANSIQIEAAANNIWMLDSYVERSTRRVRIDMRGRGTFANQSLFLTSPQLGVFDLDRVGTFVPQVPRVEDLVLEVVTDDPKTAQEITQETELNRSSVQNALTLLRRSGLVQVVAKKDRHNAYCLTPKSQGS